MIKLETLRVLEFRGIRDIELDLDCNSFVVWGPNGSGKSGIVDSIDFALTGAITRLTGPGSGGVTLARHGPHVHRRDDPAAAIVELTVRSMATGASATITRTVKNSNEYSLSPETPEMRALIDRVGDHREIILSRREIIRYILAEPGKRATEVQALLKLDQLGELRSAFRSAQTKAERSLTEAETQRTSAEAALLRHLDLKELLASEVLRVVNDARSVLQLAPSTTLATDTDFAEGINSDIPFQVLNKASAMRDVDALIDTKSADAERAADVQLLEQRVQAFNADQSLAANLATRELVASGLRLITEATCPLCDLEWPTTEDLRAHLEQKIELSSAAVQFQGEVMATAGRVADGIGVLDAVVQSVANVASQMDDNTASDALAEWSASLCAARLALADFDAVRSRVESLIECALNFPADIAAAVDRLRDSISARPDDSDAKNAHTFLIVAQERWRAVGDARASLARRQQIDAVVREIYDAYCAAQDIALNDLYDAVQSDFAKFYAQLNSDDEATFRATLEPSAAKLDLSVDFHGLGMFPPSAYHSEGHQDGMGVCLYLALVRQLLGDEFHLAVLDDVVMSVDTSHRRQFCNLLRQEFPDTQFVITTHDTVWARQMHSAGLIQKKAQAHFLQWSIDGGPVLEQGKDFWDDIADDLARDDVPVAAARLRRNLEAALAALADSLRSQVVYKADNNHELGELLPSVRGKYAKLLKQAANSANSYGNDTVKEQVAALQDRRATVGLLADGEQWAINPAVHFNEWANFSKEDFEPVIAAWREFLEMFTCDKTDCHGWLQVIRSGGSEVQVRCGCGALSLSLQTK